MISYFRQSNTEDIRKTIASKAKNVFICPVEPINTPKTITSYLLLEFETSLIIEPESKSTVFLKFPIEIGIFLKHGKKTEIIDIFGLGKQKFILYGKPEKGIICKHWKSAVHHSIPEANPLLEGVLELSINNQSTNWVEITKSVLNAYGMKIFFDAGLVAMKAHMLVENKETAETGFEDSPLRKKMEKSMEVYTLSRLSITSTKYKMEYGL
jgi:hypothetical protein